MPKIYDIPFPQTPQTGHKKLLTADASYETPVTNGVILLTGGANDTRIDAIRVKPLGTNVATVLRIFVNDGLGVVADNFSLVHSATLPATTAQAAAIDTGDSSILLLPFNYDNAGGGQIPPYLKQGEKLYASIGTTVAAGWTITAFGGDY